MNKEEVQNRVSLDGKKIPMSSFSWDEATKTFASDLNGLVLDFKWIDNCTFDTGSSCTFTTGYSCTFDTGSSCTFTTGCSCTFDTGSSCTFNTGSDCTFKTGYSCTFDTGPSCTFTTGYSCTFDTGSSCTFDTGVKCVVVRRDEFEVIEIPKNTQIKLLPSGQKGYILKGKDEGYFHFPSETQRIEIIDSIVSRVVSAKGNVLKVINDGETNESYIVTDGEAYAHGTTLKEARESLIYKIKDRDTSMFEGLTLESEVVFEDAVKMYRKITGSCESQTKAFAQAHTYEGTKKISELIAITNGQFGSAEFVSFFFKDFK